MEEKHSFLKKFLIAIALILFILFCASQKQASALTLQATESQPPMVESGQYGRKHDGSFGGANSHYYTTIWWRTNFQSDYVIPDNNTYDLVAFKIIRLNYYTYSTIQPTVTGNQWNNTQTTTSITLDISNFYAIADGSYMTVFGYMGTSTHGNVACFTTSEIDNYVFCPIKPGMVINAFWLEIAVDAAPYVAVDIDYEVRSERTYYNYDNHQIVSQQQQTNDILTGSDTSGASSTGLNDINSSASSVSTELNNTIGTNGFVSIFTNFFSQIDNSTCTPISLPIPYTNENLVLPCLGTEFQNRVPLLWTMYVTIITGVIVLRFWRYYIDMFKHLLDPYSTGLHGVSDIAGGGK